MSNHLKYITLDQLMASVEQDLNSFADNGMIDRGKVIKVVRRVNEDIGLKINKEKNEMVEISNHKGVLPVDFLHLQMAHMCTKRKFHESGEVYGTFTEEIDCVTTDDKCATTTSTNLLCQCGSMCNGSCNGQFYVQQVFKDKIVYYDQIVPVRISAQSSHKCVTGCPNLSPSIGLHNYLHAGHHIHQIHLSEDNEVTSDLRDGKLYINYITDMIDDNGNLIILDHPLLRDYYEYAVKKHIIENFILNNDADVAEKWKLLKAELVEARMRALNFINTIEYSQIHDVYEANRKVFYNRYMKMFR